MLVNCGSAHCNGCVVNGISVTEDSMLSSDESMEIRNLEALGTLQSRALGFLNSVFPLDEPHLTDLDHRAALGQHSPIC